MTFKIFIRDMYGERCNGDWYAFAECKLGELDALISALRDGRTQFRIES